MRVSTTAEESSAAISKLRILHLDRDVVFRECLALLAADEFVYVSEESALGIRESGTDVVLVEVADPRGFELLGRIREAAPSVPAIVLSSSSDEFRIGEAFSAGAVGYLLKRDPVREVLAGIRAAARGEAPVSQAASGSLVSVLHRARSGRPAGLLALTPRETEVAKRMCAGDNMREIAYSLGVSHKTIETHRVRIYAKTGLKSPVELFRAMQRSGLVIATAEAAE